MKANQEIRLAELLEKRLEGSISEEEFAELEALLLNDQHARRLYLDLSYQHGALEQIEDHLIQEEIQTQRPALLGSRWMPAFVAALAVFTLYVIVWFQSLNYRPVATLVSSEYAAWSESSVPTAPDSPLAPGRMKLNAGIATIQFHSGATMTLEAPAHLELKTPMKANLLAGNAVIEVPDEAIGFIVETPDGYAVDHGTAFTVSVDEAKNASTFEVLDGEISVHHPRTGESQRLLKSETATASKAGVLQPKGLEQREIVPFPVVNWQSRLKTWGKEATIIFNNKRNGKHVHPDLLMATRGVMGPNWERRSIMEFRFPQSLSDDQKEISKATLRLNLVPSGIGSASHLPPVSTFAIYGIPRTEFLPENWHSKDLQWSEVPDIAECEFLGRFEIPRGLSTGNFSLSTPELTEFINQSPQDNFRFIIFRENTGVYGKALIHAFASSRHPEAAGPILEVEYAE